MRRYSVKPRFFVFLTLFLVLIAFIASKLLGSGTTYKEDVIFSSESSVTQESDCVIIRDESLFASASTVRVEYLAAEDSLVSEGDDICYLYATGYTESLLERLETARENIQAYHRELLGTIVDSNLDRLDEIVRITSEQFRSLAINETNGNLRFVINQLKTAMQNRQEYLRQNKRDDTKLTKLYDDENTRKTSIQSWQTTATADRDGVVSFYVDGFEVDLSPAMLTHLTPSDIETVVNGGELASSEENRRNGFYRIVNQNEWYIALVSHASEWSPVVGQIYYLTFDGYKDLRFAATVTNVQKNSDALLGIFKIEDPIGPMIYERTGHVQMTNNITSLAVNTNAIATVNGETGIWLNDTPGGTFVRIHVLSSGDGISQIEPVVAGALNVGQKILIK